MNAIHWLRWRLRVPHFSDDLVVRLGQGIAWRETPVLHKTAASVKTLGLPVTDPNTRYRLWLTEFAAWELARRSRTVSPALLERFFDGFWGVAAREMTVDLRGGVVSDAAKLRGDLTALVDKLETPATPEELRRLSQTLGAGAESWERSKVLSGFLRQAAAAREASELTLLGLYFGYKLVACAELLDSVEHLGAA